MEWKFSVQTDLLALHFFISFRVPQGLTGLRLMGIVHADLKPDNIMFCSGPNNSPSVKIIDFGWAFRAKDAFAMHKKKFQAVPYRAPEVCFGAGGLGHGLDVWALGCIMPEIVTGVKLFGAADEERLIGLMVRALRVPDSLKAHPAARLSSGDAVPLTVGWTRFRVSVRELFHRQKRFVFRVAVDLRGFHAGFSCPVNLFYHSKKSSDPSHSKTIESVRVSVTTFGRRPVGQGGKW